MATKTDLITAIGTALSVVITRAKVILSDTAVVNELYPTKVLDSSGTETYTTKTDDFSYSIQIVKQGRSVRMNGSYTSLRAYALPSGTKVFELKNNEFKGDTSYYLGINSAHAPASQINTISAVGVGVTTTFSVTYNSNA